MKQLLLIISTVALLCTSFGKEVPKIIRYEAYEGLESEPTLKVLEGVSLRDVNIRNKSLRDAIRIINRVRNKEGDRSVINCVIRYPRAKRGGSGAQVAGRYKTILVVKKIDFASAVDNLCDQVGYKWLIEKDEKTGVPVLVIKP